jgi:hypothetical protein
MSGVSVQVGPRSVGERCAAWGLAIARDRFMTVLVVAAVVFEAVLVTVIMLANAAARDSGPAVFTPPTAFCPAGQYVTSISASGWPVCVPGH